MLLACSAPDPQPPFDGAPGTTTSGTVAAGGNAGSSVATAAGTTSGSGGAATTGTSVPGMTTASSATGTGGSVSTGSGGAESPDAGDEMPPSLIGDVEFSMPSQTFVEELAVSMTSKVAGAEIRYTLDGTEPTSSSSLYDGSPLTITETAQLRAAPFVEQVPGNVSSAIYIRRTFDYTSDIPLVIMEGYAAGQPEDKETWVDLAYMVFEPRDGMSALASLPTLATRAGYRRRGQSSANFPKTPYRVELWDNADQDADYNLLGMGADSDWAMIGPCSDSSLVRNAFVYSLSRELGLSAMRLVFAEVFINYDGGPLEEADYFGVYAVTQTVKNQKTRLDLKQLEPDATTLPEISGGYIFKFDQAAVDEDEVEIFCESPDSTSTSSTSSTSTTGFGPQGLGPGGCFADLELVDPDPTNEQQVAFITEHLQAFHDLLHSDPLGDYMSMIDVRSFVDHFIINEISRDVDAYIRSHYMHKDRDGAIVAGPVWDYNFSLGNISDDLEGWQWEEGRQGSNDWYDIIAADPAFFALVQARWQELRPTLLSDAEIAARIDAVAAPLVNAGPRDLVRWPVGECLSFDGFRGGNMDTPEQPSTWEGQIQYLKDWTRDRMAWLDSQLL